MLNRITLREGVILVAAAWAISLLAVLLVAGGVLAQEPPPEPPMDMGSLSQIPLSIATAIDTAVDGHDHEDAHDHDHDLAVGQSFSHTISAGGSYANETWLAHATLPGGSYMVTLDVVSADAAASCQGSSHVNLFDSNLRWSWDDDYIGRVGVGSHSAAATVAGEYGYTSADHSLDLLHGAFKIQLVASFSDAEVTGECDVTLTITRTS